MQIHLYVDVDYFMKIGLFFGGFFAGRIFFFHRIHTEVDG